MYYQKGKFDSSVNVFAKVTFRLKSLELLERSNSEFWQIWPKLDILCDSDKHSENDLFVSHISRSVRPVTNSSVKTAGK